MKIKFYNFNVLAVFALGTAIVLQSCLGKYESEEEKLIKDQDDKIRAFLTAQNLTAEKTAFGMYYLPVESNSAGKKVEEKNIVEVYYTIKELGAATGIDTVTAALNKPPLKFMHGINKVAPIGLDILVSFMREGEKYRAFVPSYLAYGNFTLPGLINTNAILDIEVKVQKIITESEQELIEDASIKKYIQDKQLIGVDSIDNGIYYQMNIAGDGTKPQVGSMVSVHYTGKFLNGKTFDTTEGKNPFTFRLGSGSVIKGWDVAIAKLSRGEKATIIIPSHMAYGVSEGVVVPLRISGIRMPTFSVLVFDVQIVGIN
jgi:FKBP-type peptidyl-prolyl cis-trans isomerase FkpA